MCTVICSKTFKRGLMALNSANMTTDKTGMQTDCLQHRDCVEYMNENR